MTASELKQASKEELMTLLGKSIPAPDDRIQLVTALHDRGHYGADCMIATLYNDQNIWWKEMRSDVEKMVKNCNSCLKYNIHQKGYHPPRTPHTALPWEWLQVDLMVMPVAQSGHGFILTCLDLFSSFVVTRPLLSKSAAEVARNLYEIICTFGPPRVIQSDGGREFVNSTIKEISKLFGIDFKISTPYHKGSVGSIERLNGTLGRSLKKLLGGATSNWSDALPAATLYYNTTVRSLHKSSPHAIFFAHALQEVGGGDTEQVLKDITFEDWLQDHDIAEYFDKQHRHNLQRLMEGHKRVRETIYPAIQESRTSKKRKSAERFTATHRIIKDFLPVGTRVMALDVNKTSKHDQNFVGPYQVTEVRPSGTYLLTDDLGQTLRRGISQLKVIPEAKTDEKSYELDKIIEHKGHGKHIRYLVSWKGYGEEDNSWLSSDKFDDDKIIQEYWKSKPKQIIVRRSKKSVKRA
jgi:hypothetical protein